MRKLFVLAGLTATMAASPVLAQTTATGTVDIDGSVASRCMFTLPNASISLGELSLAATGKLDVTKVNGQTATLKGWCNGTASTMRVTTTELTTPVSASGFDSRVDYTATAVANSVPASDSSLTAGAGAGATVGQFAGDVVVTLSAASSPTSAIMTAGTYTGNVQVTLSPTP